MVKNKFSSNITIKELLFQVILTVLLCLATCLDRKTYSIHLTSSIFFLSYTLAALFINYHLLPLYFYKKRYFTFYSFTFITIILLIIVEEFILERIFYPDSRGKDYSGCFYALFNIIPILFIYVGCKFAWDAHHKQHELNTLKNIAKESELQFLKSQVNPHFLFNNLNNLYSYAIANSPKTPSIILELSAVLRYMLYECQEDNVPLSKEFAHLKSFIELNSLQIEDRGVIDFDFECDTSQFTIAPLILIVFIENAFKHSTASQSDTISIKINLSVSKDGLLQFVCKNSYQSATNTDDLSKGIGLINVKKRLHLLYPDTHQLTINKTPSLYEVHLQLQLNPTSHA